jgi:SNF2 family DNA or RNA helicase
MRGVPQDRRKRGERRQANSHVGQHRPINVTRLIIENSIEARILDLQKKKENLAADSVRPVHSLEL